MGEFYYVGDDQKPAGPVSMEALQGLKTRGAIGDESLVCRVGDSEWRSLKNFLPASTTTLQGSEGSPPPVPSPVVQGQSRLATTALILGCCSFLCGFFSGLPALICGILAIRKIDKNPGMGGMGMAVAGVCLGAFSVVGTFFIAGLAVPAIHGALTKAKQAQDVAFIQQVGVAAYAYAMDHDGHYPDDLSVLKESGALDESMFVDPETGGDRWKITSGLDMTMDPDTVLLQSADWKFQGRNKGRAVYRLSNVAEWEKAPEDSD